ncbi:TetR/AcrR family transcriptional regulator [Stenotrophomonas maltophilia]|uniref:TetR/AcrR family transcriptional regulator n=1 Tax=Stenotrophomonas maltophilia TaxID=40324 RepID=UPI0009B2D27D
MESVPCLPPPASGPQRDSSAYETGPVRRTPVQDRGRRRVEQILDAAAEVIAGVGVDNATTNAIAARAGASVGILYKFFPHKVAIVEALAVRYVGDTEKLLSRQEQEGIAEWPLRKAIDWVVRALMDFHLAHPAYQHVYRAARSSSSDQGMLLLDQTKRVVEHLLALRMPNVSAQQREWHATAAVEAAHALVVYACALPLEKRERLIEETASMLTRYLTPDYVPGAVSSPQVG